MDKRPAMTRLSGWLRLFYSRIYVPIRTSLKFSIVIFVSLRVGVTDMGGAEGMTRQTPVGHRDVLVLADRSVLDLNADTTVFAKQTAYRRQVFLEQGEIRATVQHDETRPLEVFANRVVLQDLGTQFDVSSHDRTTTVAVTSGKVQVLERREDGSLVNPVTLTTAGARRDPVFLVIGDTARLEEQGGTVRVFKDRNDLGAAQSRSAWLEGQVAGRKQRLDEALWQFERYNTVRFVFDDPAIAQLEIGGGYDLANLSDFLLAMKIGLDVEAVPVEGDGSVRRTYILRRASKGSRGR